MMEKIGLAIKTWLYFIAIIPFALSVFVLRRGLIGWKVKRLQNGLPSFTAELVCIYRAILSLEGYLNDYVAIDLLDWDARCLVWFVVMLRRLRGKTLNIHSSVLGILIRTKEIDDYLIKKQPRQVVLLGAGLDARGWRMGKELPKGVVFYEVDAPSTQKLKLDLIKRAKERNVEMKGSEINYVSVDFSSGESFMQKLKESGFDTRESKTVFVIEGVTMYLEREDVERMMKSISKECCKGTSVVVQVLHIDAFGGKNAKFADKLGEKWKWAIDDDDDVVELFQSMGYKNVKVETFKDSFIKRFPTRPLHPDLNQARGKTILAYLDV